MTNADVIRRMTDDELYEFLSEWECGDIDYAVTFCDLCKGGGNELNLDCDGCRKHWLTRNAVEYGGLFYWKRNKDFTDRKTESDSEIPNNFAKDINVRSKDEPKLSEIPTSKCHYEPKADGILFKGNLKEGNYKLIKTTNGWVLEGNDIAYYGEPQTERSE